MLVHSPPIRSLLVRGHPDIYEAARHILEVRDHNPVGLEGMDDQRVTYMERKSLNTNKLALLPEGAGWLLVELGGETKDEANQKAHGLMDALRQQEHPPSMKLYDTAEEEDQVWLIRESGLAATALVPGMKDTWPGWEESAVAPEHVFGGALVWGLRQVRKSLCQ